MKFNNFKGALMLMLASFLWGTTFVAQSIGSSIGAMTFLASRSYIGFIAIYIALIFLRKKENRGFKTPKFDVKTLQYGLICGSILFLASGMQQIGMGYTTAGKAGFLTALYIVIVPILGIFLKRKTSPIVFFSVVLAAVGTYFLSVTDGFTIELGDTYIIISALFYSCHILIIDRFAVKTDPVKLSCVQFIVCALLSTLAAFMFEEPSFQAIASGILPILYAGILSSGVAYTLQIVGQCDTPPVVASLIMSLESVFAALAGWVVLKEILDSRELLGCALVFAAVIIAQIPSFMPKSKLQKSE